ncbi:MAG: hypothetical protein M1473_01540 [Firmicutes bacterium]|nr:hypothetical protein [Bacillota bacterium]
MLGRQRGLSLLELVLVMGVSSALVVGWTALVSRHFVDLDKQSQQLRAEQGLYQFGIWLSQELERARDQGDWDWHWNDAEQCLLYSETGGVRLRQGQMQWRGGSRLCHQNGWVALTDADTFHITQWVVLANLSTQLNIEAQVGDRLMVWQYRFNGALPNDQGGIIVL